MKKPSKKLENSYISIVAYLVAFPLCAVIWITKKIVWPLMCFFTKNIIWALLCFVTKVVVKQILKRLTKKEAGMTKAILPTPEIFKDAPNLGRAREIQLDN